MRRQRAREFRRFHRAISRRSGESSVRKLRGFGEKSRESVRTARVARRRASPLSLPTDAAVRAGGSAPIGLLPEDERELRELREAAAKESAAKAAETVEAAEGAAGVMPPATHAPPAVQPPGEGEEEQIDPSLLPIAPVSA